MQFIHVCCVGKSHLTFEVKGLAYRTEDALKVLKPYKEGTALCGFVQVWSIEVLGLARVVDGTQEGQSVSSPVDTYWDWDRRNLK